MTTSNALVAVRKLVKTERVDDPDPPSGVNPPDSLGMAEIRVHPRGGIQKESPEEMCRGIGIFFLSREMIGQGESSHCIRKPAYLSVIGDRLALRVSFPVLADIGKTVRLGRIGPVIRGQAVVIMRVDSLGFLGKLVGIPGNGELGGFEILLGILNEFFCQFSGSWTKGSRVPSILIGPVASLEIGQASRLNEKKRRLIRRRARYSKSGRTGQGEQWQ